MNWRQACSLMDAPHANDISAKMLRTPEAYGMAFEEVAIPATDGVKLSAWYIPAKDKNSKKLAICSHQSWAFANKSGFVGMYMPAMPGLPGMIWQNPIDYVLLHKVLHDDGFHVLAFDMRNHGSSARSKPSGWGVTEFQDAAGVMDYINSHPTLQSCRVALMTFCVSGMAMLKANHYFPDKFKNVEVCCATNLMSCTYQHIKNPVMCGIMTEEGLNAELAKKQAKYIANGSLKEDPKIQFSVNEIDAAVFAKSMQVPVLFCTPEKDPVGNQTADTPYIFREFPNDKSEFHFIGKHCEAPYKTETNNRCEGYNFFQKEGVQVMYDFLHKHMSV